MNWQLKRDYQIHKKSYHTIQDQLIADKNRKRVSSSLQQAEFVYIQPNSIKSKYRNLKTEQSQPFQSQNQIIQPNNKFCIHPNNREITILRKQQQDESIASIFQKRKIKINFNKAGKKSNKLLQNSDKSLDKQTIRIHQVKYVKPSMRYATVDSQLQQSQISYNKKNGKKELSSDRKDSKIKEIKPERFLSSQAEKMHDLKLMPLPFVKRQIYEFRKKMQIIKQETQSKIANLRLIQTTQLRVRMKVSSCYIIFGCLKKKRREKNVQFLNRLVSLN